MKTKLVSQWKLSPEQAMQLGIDRDPGKNIPDLLEKAVDDFINGNNASNPIVELLNTCYHLVEKEFSTERWIKLPKDIYLDKKTNGFWLIGDCLSEYTTYNTGENINTVIKHINKMTLDPVNIWLIPRKEQLLNLTNLSSTPFKTSYGRPFPVRYCLYNSNGKCQGYDADSDCLTNSSIGYPIPFLPCKKPIKSKKHVLINILQSGFFISHMDKNSDYYTLLKLFHYKNDNFYANYKLEADKVVSKLTTEIIENSLLSEDNKRVDIQPYHSKMLQDTELGHWSLWQDEIDTKDHIPLNLSSPLVARDPKSSIHDGVVAIDFGTKSTVVVYQKDNVSIHPMRIGTGDLSKEIAAHHYENPTIMEFINLENFVNAYQANNNKPFTRWQDLTISHTAQNSMQGSESSKFNTFLDAIKQWAGDKSRKLKIVGQHGTVIDLPAFLELKDDDFNPIEIYAYYLGLYINNLNNGIFIDYIMSFPVTYEMAVRDKIIASFKKGLTKSLPAELGKQALTQLTVSKGASEPAAYALTALQEYGIEPEGEERIFYSVFDFGGGTTDFDFGIYREPTDNKDKRRFDYVIEHFGAGGDKFLGGENLLELLAFEVFKNNKTALLAKGIQFEKHPEKDAFAGSEQLISNSQEAKTNTKQLCIALRPFWEEHADFSFDASGELSVTLTDINGVQHSAFALDIDVEQLEKILSDRIERGVINFFNALRLAFSNSQQQLSDINKVNIFLGGNSSQSRFVKELFEKHIAIQHQKMGLPEGVSRFELFSPLGGDKSNVEKPTGKTGVAFGLITAREGGRIKVIDHNVGEQDIRFKYYLGHARKNKFKPLIDREVNFNEWVEFTYADYQKFEIFYTEQPSCSTGELAINDPAIKKKTVRLDITDDDASVYLRVVSPSDVEFVIAQENEITNNIYLNTIQRIEL